MPARDGRWLVFRQTVNTDMRAGAAGKTADTYFENLGYHLHETSPARQYRRGSWLAGFYHPNPDRQQTEITVDILPQAGGETLLEVEMRVSTLGNVPLSKDYEFWRAELQGFANALHFGYIDPALSEMAAERAMWYSVATLLGAGLGALITALMLSMALLLLLL
jgi:hypothetical protein